jgi:hypothetical protein
VSQNQRTCDGEWKEQVLKKEAEPYLEGEGEVLQLLQALETKGEDEKWKSRKYF